MMGVVALAAVVIINLPNTLAQYSGGVPPKTPTKPYLTSPTYRGPVLSTALPSSGPFSHGLAAAPPVRGNVSAPAARGGYSPFATPHASRMPLGPTQQPFLVSPTISSRNMANYAIRKGVTRGLQF